MKNLVIITLFAVLFSACDSDPIVDPPCTPQFTRFIPENEFVDTSGNYLVEFTGISSCYQNSFTILVSRDSSFNLVEWTDLYVGHTYFDFSHDFGANSDTWYWKVTSNGTDTTASPVYKFSFQP